MFRVVIEIWSVGDSVLTRRGFVVRAKRCGAVIRSLVRTVCWSGSSKATVSNMIDYLPIEPFQLGAVCNLLLLIKKRVYIRPWGLEQRMIGCNVWVQPIVRLHSGRIIG